jgi:transcriptional regulator with XRE-family HTH domain
MDIGKSIRVAMAMRGLRGNQLAERLQVTAPTISVMLGRKTCAGQTLQDLANIFGMKVSEFVALGED